MPKNLNEKAPMETTLVKLVKVDSFSVRAKNDGGQIWPNVVQDDFLRTIHLRTYEEVEIEKNIKILYISNENKISSVDSLLLLCGHYLHHFKN